MTEYIVKNIKKDSYIKRLNLRGTDYTQDIKLAQVFPSREKANKCNYGIWDCPVVKPETKGE